MQDRLLWTLFAFIKTDNVPATMLTKLHFALNKEDITHYLVSVDVAHIFQFWDARSVFSGMLTQY